MLKSLYPGIDWDGIEIVGFDMDGTLYDEADFISQVYHPISCKLSSVDTRSPEEIHSWMLARWMEKGSSYNHIFEEVLSGNNIADDLKSQLVSDCLDVFRGFSPNLTLSARVKAILDVMHKNFGIFLISNGSSVLQARKFQSLGLGRWFSPDNVAISGRYGPDFSKPSTKIIEKIKLLNGRSFKRNAVYFGDRDIDAEFSINAGFNFVPVKCMNLIR